MRSAAKHNLHATESTPQTLALHFIDAEGVDLDLTGYALTGAVEQEGILALECVFTDASNATVEFPSLAAGRAVYDLFLRDGGGKEYPLIFGAIHVLARCTPPADETDGDAPITEGLEVTIPEATDAQITVVDNPSLVTAAQVSVATAAAETATEAATSAEEAAGRAEAALEQIPVDEGGNMSISGGLTVAGVANLNGGASVPATATLTLAGTVSAGNEVFSGEVMASMYWAAALYYGTQFVWNRANILRYFSMQALSGGGTGAGLAAIPDDTPMPSNLAGLTNGESLFSYSTLKRLPAAWTFDNLVNGFQMFANAALEELPAGMVLGSLTNGRLMFVHLRTATSLPEGLTLASLQNGRAMFSSVKLTGLPESLNLGALTDGYTMFQQARLDKESAVRVLGTLSAMTDGAEHIFTIGIAAVHEGDAEVAAAVAGAEAKGWTVEVRFNS